MSQMKTRCVTQAVQVSDTVAEHKGNWLSASLISVDTTRALEKNYSDLSNNLFRVCVWFCLFVFVFPTVFLLPI